MLAVDVRRECAPRKAGELGLGLCKEYDDRRDWKRWSNGRAMLEGLRRESVKLIEAVSLRGEDSKEPLSLLDCAASLRSVYYT